MYILFIVLIIIASILIILAVLAQSPKSGMAANFGVSNQVMGVRQTSDMLEKFTWTMAGVIMALSLMASVAMSSHKRAGEPKSDDLIEQVVGGSTNAQMPNEIITPQATEAAAEGEVAPEGETAQEEEATAE